MRELLTLHYHRPPDRVEVFQQEIVYTDQHVLVSLLPATTRKAPLFISGQLALEPGSPIVWFTFPGARHDIGRFHTATGEFTGFYSDVLEPVQLNSRTELTLTDLFLDVWVGAGRDAEIIDVEELEHALAQGWITDRTAAAARIEAERIVRLYHEDAWPPAIVNEWTLERVRRRED